MGGPIDGRMLDVDGSRAPEWIDAENPVDHSGLVYRYVKDGEVMQMPGLGRYLHMRYAGERIRRTPPS